jgi:hypothetical protein
MLVWADLLGIVDTRANLLNAYFFVVVKHYDLGDGSAKKTLLGLYIANINWQLFCVVFFAYTWTELFY